MLANSFGYSMNLFKAKSGLKSVQEDCYEEEDFLSEFSRLR
jgi:hypothetical protein